MAIPPAWTGVWIAESVQAHLQARGRDAARRRQYRYHDQFRAAREREKHDRVVAFGARLPTLRKQVQRDLERGGLPAARVLAGLVRLLDTTLARIGNARYVAENGSHGLTTLRKRHAELHDTATLSFSGKSGRDWEMEVEEPRVLAVIGKCLETRGKKLFKYREDGEARAVNSDDVNAYLADAVGAPITAKDFRVWGGTVRAAVELARAPDRFPEQAPASRVVRAMEATAEVLGNTPAVCRASYVHPAILEALPGTEDAPLRKPLLERRFRARPPRKSLSAVERVVLDYLKSELVG